MALELASIEIGEFRGEFVQSLLKPSARPNSPIASFRSAIPSPDFATRIDPDGKRKVSSMGKESSDFLARYNGKVGILAVDGRGYNAGNAAKNLAQAFYALDFDVSSFGCIVALLEENLMCADGEAVPYDRDRAEELGIEIVYDLKGVFGQGPVDRSSGTLTVIPGHISFDGSTIDRSDRLDAMIRHETLREMASVIRKYRLSRPSWYSDGNYNSVLGAKDMQGLAEMLSFGQWRLEELAPEDPDRDGYECSIPLESRIHGMVKGLVCEESVKRIDELCRIWKTSLANYGLDFDVSNIALSGNMEELGLSLGIDSGIEAYLSGVPIDDMMA